MAATIEPADVTGDAGDLDAPCRLHTLDSLHRRHQRHYLRASAWSAT
jgi:hypothetical protein